ncbi:MAG: hypothetical protein HY912_04465 [Desulfomonile tiedjei]|uniref:BioF2-like acetyltransferase domain-containing protein n=1 Tax=Desulfomonile tiedjei TaxID=2358 RepID=A0A9D6Z2M3_9BACT|nr:hypothetical protein [Desulfomonile tiedjei]
MNSEVFAEWFRRQGLKVIKTASSWWVELGMRTYQAFPYQWIIQPDESELDDLLIKNRALALRYSTHSSAGEGMHSYHAVFQGDSYGLDRLGKWARKNVRRGLSKCSVERISLAELARTGWSLQEDTLNRQSRNPSFSSENWQKMCCAAGDLPGFTAWGAFTKEHGKLAASVITFQMDDWVYMLYQQCCSDMLALHANNALAFEVTTRVLEGTSTKSILYGLHSLDAPPSVDEFKFRMGYYPKPVKQRVKFNRLIAPGVNSYSYWGLKKLASLVETNATLSKAEGMCRFFLQGKAPTEKKGASILKQHDGASASARYTTALPREE